MKDKLALALILAVAALLRFGGLSHDLHEGKVYHPDTPKQVRATQRFLEGRYFLHTGIADYDGYPYFNAHLVEYLCRLANPPRVAALKLLGVPVTPGLPDVITLFWITLLFNATVATLLVWLVHRLVREHFGGGPALAAAAFMALSPVDVTACHYANGDTTAAFFTTLSLLFALRIARDGRWRDYLLAVVFAACGFAAKYHAGLAALPILLAHAARYPSPRAFFSRASWCRLLACAAAGIATLFITIPTLIGHTAQVTQDIVYFFTHISKGRRLPEEVRDTGLAGKFLFSMRRNGPILLHLLGPVAAASALLALVRLAWRDFRIVILAAVPVVYFLVGVSFRPIAPPVYHTLMTPMVFILAAVFLARRSTATRPAVRRLWTAAATAAILFSMAYLGRHAVKEAFFQWHMDTRRMAGHWVEENVPASFALNKGMYTFQRHPPADKPAGTVFARGSIYPADPPASYQPLKTFAMERDSLMMFRNPDIVTHIGGSRWITSPARMPVFQRQPSGTGNQFVFDNGLTFLRDDKRLALEPGHPVTRRFVTDTALEYVLLTVRNGHLPNFITLSFGGQSRELKLAPGVTEAILLKRPRTAFPRERGLFAYRLAARSTPGPALVRVATRPGEIGLALYDAGRHAEAVSWLESATLETRNPTLAVQALAARQLAGGPIPKSAAPAPGVTAEAARIRQIVSANSIEDTYGIGPRYLDALPFLTLTNRALIHKGFKKRAAARIDSEDEDAPDIAIPEPDPGQSQSVSTPPLLLDPGHYTCSLRFAFVALPEQTPTLSLTVALPDGSPLGVTEIDLTGCTPRQRNERRIPIVVPSGIPAATLVITPRSVGGLTVERLSLSPDVLATVLGWKTVFTLASGGPPSDAAGEPMAFDVLMAMGDRAAATNATVQALECYSAAGRARPDNRLPALRLAALDRQAPQPAPWRETRIGARFRNGLRLESARFRETETTPGGSLGLNLYWDLERPDIQPGRLVVWVHFLDTKGELVFQGDHNLRQDLPLTRSPFLANPCFAEIPVPRKVPPGAYRIRLGLYLPETRKRIAITESVTPHSRTHVDLPVTVTVK